MIRESEDLPGKPHMVDPYVEIPGAPARDQVNRVQSLGLFCSKDFFFGRNALRVADAFHFHSQSASTLSPCGASKA